MGTVFGAIVLSVFTVVSTYMLCFLIWEYQGWQDLKAVGQQCDGLSINWREWWTGGGRHKRKHYGCTAQYTVNGKLIVIESYETSSNMHSKMKNKAMAGQFIPISLIYDPDNLMRSKPLEELDSITNGNICSYAFSNPRYIFCMIWGCLSLLIATVFLSVGFRDLGSIITCLVLFIVGTIGNIWYFFCFRTIKKVGERSGTINDAPPNGAMGVPTAVQTQTSVGMPMQYVQQQPMGMAQPMGMQMQQQQQQPVSSGMYYAPQGQAMMMQPQQPMGQQMGQPMGHPMQQSYMQQQYMQPQPQAMQPAPQMEGAPPPAYGTGEAPPAYGVASGTATGAPPTYA